jgi:HTH-type transcriptional regulator / antitoxin HigA
VTNAEMPGEPIAPGEYLREELSARGMSQSELARRMGRPAQVVSEIVNGRKSLTRETALELERVLGTPASVWINLEAAYQLGIARRMETAELESQASWLERFPVDEMEARGWIPTRRNAAEKVRALLQFFGVASFSSWDDYQEALGFRITGNSRLDVGALAVWVRRGEIEGRALRVSEFDEARFREALRQIRPLTRDEPRVAWEEVKRLCADAGVAAVVVPELPRIGANGVARWLTAAKALIQLNLRYAWADIFWFTLFHEAAHVLVHESRRIFVDLEGNPRRDPREADANRVAEELLIPTNDWEEFVQRSNFSAADVADFADDLGIHPGIVVGRLQHVELVPWRSNLNSLRTRLMWVWHRDGEAG